jgi:general secretion pathway protein A
MYGKHFGFCELPFNVNPDPRFYYDNLNYQEASAVLRYGVEARKGFIVITGDTGTGKTMLLRRFMDRAESAIHTALIFNPQRNFAELLQSVLSDLGIPHPSDDRFALVRQLSDYLIEQRRRGDIVAVLVDEAQNLSAELLEELRLLSNFETREDKLIQIVLVGQPELEKRLDQPGLRQLKQRASLWCRLLPLRSEEVSPYIASRLRTVGYEGKELFAPEAIEKIAGYSEGIPRLINVLCDNALVLACAAAEAQVSGAVVEKVARGLQFKALPRLGKQGVPTALAITRGQQDSANPGSEERIVEPQRTDAVAFKGAVGFSGAANTWFWIPARNLAALAFVVGMGALLYFLPSGDYFATLGRDNGDAVGTQSRGFERGEPPSLVRPREESSQLQKPALQDSRSPVRDLNERAAIVLETDKLAGAQDLPADRRTAGKATSNTGGTPRDKTRAASKSTVAVQSSGNSTPSNGKLASRIQKAISNRAIEGVEVSVVNGTVSLAGQVATERQKAAAVRAARSVAGVRDVRDRIIVEAGVAPMTLP